MITFNTKDFNIPELVQSSGFTTTTKVRYNYRIYGLSKEGNPAVLIEGRSGVGLTEAKFKPLIDLFNNNKVSCKFAITEKGKNHIYIGLRADVRENLPVASKILRTIIYELEDKLEKIDSASKIKCPVFKEHVIKVKQQKAEPPNPLLKKFDLFKTLEYEKDIDSDEWNEDIKYD